MLGINSAQDDVYCSDVLLFDKMQYQQYMFVFWQGNLSAVLFQTVCNLEQSNTYGIVDFLLFPYMSIL